MKVRVHEKVWKVKVNKGLRSCPMVVISPSGVTAIATPVTYPLNQRSSNKKHLPEYKSPQHFP